MTTKIVIANGPVANGGGYLWWNNVDKSANVTDSLGNVIGAVQTGANSVDAFATMMMTLIDTEKSALPGGS